MSRQRAWRSRRRPSTRCSQAPAPEASRWTSTRRWCTPPGTRCRSCASCVRTRSSRTSSRSRPRSRRSCAGVPRATLIPHVYPENEPEHPIYSLGARLPRTAAGRAMWRRAQWPVRHGVERGRVELNETRARLGLPALEYGHGGTSRELALVATFPQLEYSRAWPQWAHVVGPLMWEPPAKDVELPTRPRPRRPRGPARADRALDRPGPRSPTAGAALRGLADAPVRVLATWNRRLPSRPSASARERKDGRVGLLRAHDARPAMWSYATPATARSSAPWPAAARSSRARMWET